MGLRLCAEIVISFVRYWTNDGVTLSFDNGASTVDGNTDGNTDDDDNTDGSGTSGKIG